MNKLDSFIEWKEYILNTYRDKIDNYDVLVRIISLLTYTDIINGLTDINLRYTIYSNIKIVYYNREEELNLYDSFINYLQKGEKQKL